MVDYRVETFLLLCQLMNYRKTAQALGITQPAVTQQIHYLERQYGCKLFTYKNARLQKTEAALTLEQYARALRLKEQSLRSKLSNPVRQLRIGATKTIGDYVIKEEVRRFLRREDQALSLVVDNTEHLLKMLKENELDFAMIEGYFDRSQFDSQLFRREPFVGICPAGHPFAGKKVSMGDLVRETIIHREAGSGTRAILEEKLHGYNESLDRFRRQICVSSFPVILDLVKHGLGISFVYEVLADSDPDVSKFTIQGEPIVREFNIVYLKYADLKEKIGWFFPGRAEA